MTRFESHVLYKSIEIGSHYFWRNPRGPGDGHDYLIRIKEKMCLERGAPGEETSLVLVKGTFFSKDHRYEDIFRGECFPSYCDGEVDARQLFLWTGPRPTLRSVHPYWYCDCCNQTVAKVRVPDSDVHCCGETLSVGRKYMGSDMTTTACARTAMPRELDPTRECGSCTECCTAHGPYLGTVQPCRYVGQGCTIHETRPDSCRSWFCEWRYGLGDDESRPDRLGVVPHAGPDGSIRLALSPRDFTLQMHEHLCGLLGWMAGRFIAFRWITLHAEQDTPGPLHLMLSGPPRIKEKD